MLESTATLNQAPRNVMNLAVENPYQSFAAFPDVVSEFAVGGDAVR
jgi:hypothetical protein